MDSDVITFSVVHDRLNLTEPLVLKFTSKREVRGTTYLSMMYSVLIAHCNLSQESGFLSSERYLLPKAFPGPRQIVRSNIVMPVFVALALMTLNMKLEITSSKKF